jgi:hypothetical protein
MTAVEVRQQLVQALSLDLIGPGKGSPLEAEILPQHPSAWYKTGFLVPFGAGEHQRLDETVAEEISQGSDPGDQDEAGTPEPAAARRAYLPSSMGLSLLVPADATQVQVTARWGDYRREEDKANPQGEVSKSAPTAGGDSAGRDFWMRTQREHKLTLQLPEQTATPKEFEVPDSKGMKLVLSVRPVPGSKLARGLVPKGARSASVFLVNRRPPGEGDTGDEQSAFQAELVVEAEFDLVPRPNTQGLESNDWDERVADLQYRDACEFAVGHGVATRTMPDDAGRCRLVRTCWVPEAEVERVAASPIDGVELGIEALAGLSDGSEARNKLSNLVSHYREWIELQKTKVPVNPTRRKEVADLLLGRARTAADRIEAGIELLQDPQVLDAFRVANRAVATALRRRFGFTQNIEPAAVKDPAWHPFQLAFLLMNLRGVAQPSHADREVVDLLFFPTGGGKTEAYLGLAAFTLVLRRLRNPGIRSAGLSVLMRYTLRLLTLEQLSRAATLICALELERQKDEKKLGPWPFEIGLWVGKAATPNKMGKRGDGDGESARAKTTDFQTGASKASPIPLEECPWCGTKFTKNSFQLLPNRDFPVDLRVNCINRRCDFSRGRSLPILGVDEPIYRRLPCFLIATVDKFAAMPWTGNVGAFFGRVERYDNQGFYGPCDPGLGQLLPEQSLPPPELVIQDELHLISGPLGTMVGLYETALDALCSREVAGKRTRPKIVASTATVRNAEKQIRALFNRRQVDIFPPSGPDRRDSFFARTQTTEESNARLYVGVAAQGRSPKVLLLRTILILMSAAQKAYVAGGGKKNPNNPADSYMTLLGYFNSLRELGGTRRIVEDEVGTQLRGFGHRKRVGEKEGLFADREIDFEVLELTSREPTDRVAEAKRRLAQRFYQEERVDVALATNMISVGLDITRLGLMVVHGQPKTSAEYIQATSRVGRDPNRPGLVVTLFNIHRPRDRSHYERFGCYHESFYRHVEATSVTPFSPRALDRGLAGTLVALARLGHLPLTAAEGATAILTQRSKLDDVVETLSERAETHAAMVPTDAEALRQRVRDRCGDLLDGWSKIAHEYQQVNTELKYQEHEGAGGPKWLLHDFLDAELKSLSREHQKFRANRSMREVEPSVNVWLRDLDDVEIEEEDEA